MLIPTKDHDWDLEVPNLHAMGEGAWMNVRNLEIKSGHCRAAARDHLGPGCKEQ